MINTSEVLTHMRTFALQLEAKAKTEEDKDPVFLKILLEAIEFMVKSTAAEFKQLQRDEAKIAFIRQLFTVWKAVCARLPKEDFYEEKYDAVRAFLLYYEIAYPEVYVLLYRKNVFLGIKLSAEALDKIREIEEKIIASVQQEERKEMNKEFIRYFFLGQTPA